MGDLEGVERGDEMGEEQGDHGPGVGGRKSPGQDVERPDPDGPCGEEQLEDDPGGEQGVGVFFVLGELPDEDGVEPEVDENAGEAQEDERQGVLSVPGDAQVPGKGAGDKDPDQGVDDHPGVRKDVLAKIRVLAPTGSRFNGRSSSAWRMAEIPGPMPSASNAAPG